MLSHLRRTSKASLPDDAVAAPAGGGAPRFDPERLGAWLAEHPPVPEQRRPLARWAAALAIVQPEIARALPRILIGGDSGFAALLGVVPDEISATEAMPGAPVVPPAGPLNGSPGPGTEDHAAASDFGNPPGPEGDDPGGSDEESRPATADTGPPVFARPREVLGPPCDPAAWPLAVGDPRLDPGCYAEEEAIAIAGRCEELAQQIHRALHGLAEQSERVAAKFAHLRSIAGCPTDQLVGPEAIETDLPLAARSGAAGRARRRGHPRAPGVRAAHDVVRAGRRAVGAVVAGRV